MCIYGPATATVRRRSNNLADLLHRAGRGEEAMAHLKEAVAIFADVGTEPGAFEPAVEAAEL